MENLAKRYIDIAKEKNPNEPEFIQTVTEVLTSIEPVLKAHKEYENLALVERLIEPERVIMFRVPWVDDEGICHVNKGYRVQFNSSLGPYKGGLRFSPNVNLSVIKFLGFEQTFKNSLTGLPIGGGKGGSDFDPHGKSDNEIMRFCQSFIAELYRHIGPDTDVPAGDLGVGGREIGYMYGMYKKLTNRNDGTYSGKPLSLNGLKGRAEATGFGIVTFLNEILKHENDDIKGKTIIVSGYGNVSWGTIKKINMLGGKVITISGHDGYIIDNDGIKDDKVDYLLEMRANHLGIEAYSIKYPTSKFVKGHKPWEVKGDIYIPCATQNEISLDDAKLIKENGGKYLVEGANMPSSNDAIAYLQKEGLIVAPSKAANAGGVACSCIEMSQNARHEIFDEDTVYEMLDRIMINIHKEACDASSRYNLGYDLVRGANIAGFERVAKAMVDQGII